MSVERFSAASILSQLKDFQRRTVNYVFERFYGANPTRRFLVADEVGLGKTLVARGIIARTIEHLQDKVKRIDIVYVCSNATIARQNINRLKVGGIHGFAMATRLTLLPIHVKKLNQNAINFISFTPGTALDLKGQGGKVEERALIYRILEKEPWNVGKGLLNLL
ncbi:MAG: helicase, partial [Deltaproteobacteria bacterium]|nr:helicase [Deltaproteobacteria bacterium]